MSSFRITQAIRHLNEINFFDVELSNKLKAPFYLVLAVSVILLLAMLIDTVIHMENIANWAGSSDYFMRQSMTAKLYCPQVFNLSLWILLFILTKSRQKATYHNYGIISAVLIAMFVVNNYLIDFYSQVYLAKAGFMVFLAGFFVALPLHEQYKLRQD